MESRKERIEAIKNDLRLWHSEGFDLEPIYDSLKNRDVKKFVSLYEKYKRLIPEMKRYLEIIKNYDDPQAIRYRKILHAPLKYEEFEDEIEEYVAEKRTMEKNEDEIYTLITGLKGIEVESGLTPGYTFETYIVHEGNELAYSAARRILEEPGTINPLIIIGESGTGKTHLLNAIGNEYLTMGKIVVYKNSEELVINQHIDFDSDILLLDDFHVLLEREDLHPLVNLILEKYSKSGKQIVIASNFSMGYYALEPSLAGKLEAGLRIELSNPSEEVRVRILKEKVRLMNADIDEDVILYLSKSISNMSKLVAVTKKILALSKILGDKPNIAMAADIIKNRISLDPGSCYLVEEEKPYRSISHLKEILTRGYAGVVISRMNPEKFEKLYRIRTEIYWLTDHDTEVPSIKPLLESVNFFLEKYIKGKYVIYIDGIDFLMSKNSPDSVIQFMRHMVDSISESQAILILSLNPRTIDEKYLKILEREMEII